MIRLSHPNDPYGKQLAKQSPRTISPIEYGSGRKSAAEAFADYFGAKLANDNAKAAYLRDAKEFANWCVERGLNLEEVQTLDVASFRDHLKAGGNSSATIKRKISGLRKLFSYLVETGSLHCNPAREVATERLSIKGGKTPASRPFLAITRLEQPASPSS